MRCTIQWNKQAQSDVGAGGQHAEQAAGLARGRKKPRRLGVILAEQGRITDRAPGPELLRSPSLRRALLSTA